MNKMCASLFFLVCNLVASEQSPAIFVATQEGNHEGVVFGALDPHAAPFVPSSLGAVLKQEPPVQNRSRLLAFIGLMPHVAPGKKFLFWPCHSSNTEINHFTSQDTQEGDQSDNEDLGLQPVFYKKTRRGKRGSSKGVYEKQKSLLPKDLLEVHDEEGRQRYFCNAIENNRPPLLLNGAWDPGRELSDKKKDLPEWRLAAIKKAWISEE